MGVLYNPEKSTLPRGRWPGTIPPYLLLGGRLVRAVVSQRAGGLLIVVNMNPDQQCNFDCAYCEVRRSKHFARRKMDVAVMSRELRHMLALTGPSLLHTVPAFARLPCEISQLRGVALSGDGEPTLCPKFLQVVEEVTKIRRSRAVPWFKLILVTNSTGLHVPGVRQGLELFTENDEIWAKLDCGTQRGMRLVNRSDIPLRQVLKNIKEVARKRPVVIQSMFCEIEGKGPSDEEIEQYVHRLGELQEAGARISLVHIYSPSREPARNRCKHLPLQKLSDIARTVREVTGLKTEVY